MSQRLMPPSPRPALCVHHMGPKYLLNHPVRPLCLAVRLRMESCGKGEARTEESHQGTPKCACEAGIAVADNGARDTKIPHNPVEKQPRNPPRIKRTLTHKTRCHPYQLCETLYAGKHCVEPPTQWQPRDEIHTPRVKTRLRHLQGLQLPGWCLGAVLRTLARRTLLAVLPNIPSHMWPPYSVLQLQKCLACTQVPRKQTVVQLT